MQPVTCAGACNRPAKWNNGQMAGRRWPVACVSLEITQRCNLDCTLCCLGESSETVRDLPLEEVFRRIDLIVAQYGPATDVQISGGKPTLRRRGELIAIVARIHQRGLRASLFTNGIKATRALLIELAQVGLTDVAFHVDPTQPRAGFASEAVTQHGPMSIWAYNARRDHQLLQAWPTSNGE